MHYVLQTDELQLYLECCQLSCPIQHKNLQHLPQRVSIEISLQLDNKSQHLQFEVEHSTSLTQGPRTPLLFDEMLVADKKSKTASIRSIPLPTEKRQCGTNTQCSYPMREPKLKLECSTSKPWAFNTKKKFKRPKCFTNYNITCQGIPNSFPLEESQ